MARQTELDVDSMKALFDQAADIAKVVPESMQGAGFQRAMDMLLGQQPVEKRTRGRRAPKRKRSPGGAGKPAREPTAAPKGTPSKRARRPGAPTALQELTETDFFQSPRTIGEVQRYLDSSRALRFTQPNLSPHLAALVRRGKLQREKNEQGIYEYRLP